MLQTLIDQKTVKPGNWSSLTVFFWFQLSKMGKYTPPVYSCQPFLPRKKVSSDSFLNEYFSRAAAPAFSLRRLLLRHPPVSFFIPVPGGGATPILRFSFQSGGITTPDFFVSCLSGGVESSEVGGCTSVLTTIVVIYGHIPSITPVFAPPGSFKKHKMGGTRPPKTCFFCKCQIAGT